MGLKKRRVQSSCKCSILFCSVKNWFCLLSFRFPYHRRLAMSYLKLKNQKLFSISSYCALILKCKSVHLASFNIPIMSLKLILYFFLGLPGLILICLSKLAICKLKVFCLVLISLVTKAGNKQETVFLFIFCKLLRA